MNGFSTSSIENAPRKAGRRLGRFLPKSLFVRALLILIIPVLLSQAITTYVFFDRHWSKMSMRLAYAVAGEVAATAHLVEARQSEADLKRAVRLAAENFDFLVSFAPGEKIGPRRPAIEPPFLDLHPEERLEHELRNVLRMPFVVSLDFRQRWVLLDIQMDDGVLHVAVPQRRLFSTTGYVVLLWMAGSAAILMMIAIIFLRNQIRPIWRLAAAAERFGKGRDVAHFKPQGSREVRRAGEAFLRMRERIKRQMDQRMAMLAGVSHDLRTPLTRLRLNLAMVPETQDTRDMLADIQSMQRMIDGYLDFVRGGEDELAQQVALGPILRALAGRQEARGIGVYLSVAEELTMAVRPRSFERCLGNLLQNAGNYARHIWVTATQDDDYAEIRIEDDGPGIPEDQYEDVFKPFYRVDTSRNTDTGGVGLGLPIAMDIISAHGGTIRLGRSQHGGLAVTITLPV